MIWENLLGMLKKIKINNKLIKLVFPYSGIDTQKHLFNGNRNY